MKKAYFYIFLILIPITLMGCSKLDIKSTNDFLQLIVVPVEQVIHFLAENFHGSYGWAIITITCIIRLLLMPFMLNNVKKQKIMQKRMVQIKPEIDSLQEKIQTTDDVEKKMAYQKEMFNLYKNNNMSITNIGCLPLIIQTPLLMGLYYEIRYDHSIGLQPFLWFNLGTSDLILTAIACLLYYLQFQFSFKDMEESKKKQLKFMGFFSPVMIGIVSLNSASALSLYWSTSALLLIVQQFISTKLYPANDVVDKV